MTFYCKIVSPRASMHRDKSVEFDKIYRFVQLSFQYLKKKKIEKNYLITFYYKIISLRANMHRDKSVEFDKIYRLVH